jgi:chromate transporter
VTTLGELARLFLKLGATSFGGPAAHIAMMEDEVVRRRGWLTHAEFLQLLAATNLIPGPNSTELALHIGWHRARWAGLLVAGTCFIVPAALLVTALAWAYVLFGTLPAAQGLLYGVKPVVVAVVTQALWRLALSAFRTPVLGLAAALALTLALLGCDELSLILGIGALVALIHGVARPTRHGTPASLLAVTPVALAPTAPLAVGLAPLFLFFVKVGSILFGSGYVLFAFLQSELVEQKAWLTQSQLLDAIAVGQFTPGPLFTTATFVGYLLAGVPGAVTATVGIFLPAFVFVALTGPILPWLRSSSTVAAFLDGVIAASLALMAVVSLHLARASIVDVPTVLLGTVSFAVLFRTRVNSTWLILAGAGVGIFYWLI